MDEEIYKKIKFYESKVAEIDNLIEKAEVFIGKVETGNEKFEPTKP